MGYLSALPGTACIFSGAQPMQFYARKRRTLNGMYHFQPDPLNRIGYYEHVSDAFIETVPQKSPHNFSLKYMKKVRVPGDWNQIPGFEHYEGSAWYYTEFSARSEAASKGKRHFLYFEGVNHKAEVYLNNEHIKSHTGAYIPFFAEVTGKLKARNGLAVRVNNIRSDRDIPARVYDWFNFGGITRPVSLVTVPATFISGISVRTERKKNGTFARVKVVLDGRSRSGMISVRIPGTGFSISKKPGKNGTAVLRGRIDADLWSPGNPRLYTVIAEYGEDMFKERTGFRTVEVNKTEILLNGKPVWLRGICMHEDTPFRTTRTMTAKHAKSLLSTAKELGCNFVRLAHYPHSELMTRTADRMGLMLWEEIPLYWSPVFSDPQVKKQSRFCLNTLIQRDCSRPSVIIWSVANETSPENDRDRIRLLKDLMDYARRLDPSRPVSFATFGGTRGGENEFVLTDPVCRHADIIGWNEYLGWYAGKPGEITGSTLTVNTDKPLIITETGGGAKRGYHGTSGQRWTEEYQEAVYKGQVKLWEKTENCRGASPWILMDFKSPIRQNEFQRGYNRKGLVDTKLKKKKAFSVLRDFYTRMAEQEI